MQRKLQTWDAYHGVKYRCFDPTHFRTVGEETVVGRGISLDLEHVGDVQSREQDDQHHGHQTLTRYDYATPSTLTAPATKHWHPLALGQNGHSIISITRRTRMGDSRGWSRPRSKTRLLLSRTSILGQPAAIGTTFRTPETVCTQPV